MIISEKAQEILEMLWLAEEENEPSLESNKSQEKDIDELAQLGLVEQRSRRWELTENGMTEATQAIRRHRLGERLLVDVFRTEEALMEDHACRLEHALFEGLDESICTLLGHPQFCPHGKLIPPGACCKKGLETVSRLISSLCDLEPGQQGTIAYLQMSYPTRLQKLMAMGVLPGGEISLIRRFPSIVFETGYSQFAVDEDSASAMFVRLQSV